MQAVQHSNIAVFQLTFTKPYDTYQNGVAAPVPYVVDGLFTQGGLTIFGAKPKQGKSTIARYLATCVVKGTRFLGRETTQGDVIIVNLEDQQFHVDNCLKALGYTGSDGQGQIYITSRVAPVLGETIAALERALLERPNIRLVVVDHLAKLLCLRDLNDYMAVQVGVETLHDLARRFPLLHIIALAHCKKVATDDPFDQILGSVALRGEPDTNMVIFQQRGKRFLTTETRAGRALQPTELHAEIVTLAGTDLVSDFSLGGSLDDTVSEQNAQAEEREKASYTARVIQYLRACPEGNAAQTEVMRMVKGKDQALLNAIKQLTNEGLITVDGKPLILKLVDSDMARLYTLGK
jgi:hypothetical protein